ncbi:hypothetical protein DYI37_19225 [Fulvimarina endophytica]|uniref:Uncharacterized protein n=1 Tax=Fulvimarina endophytica TaxID=2293836 RepID=A0A371WXU8_9HYPH|nr:hypothetical protein [Fulvimarina endophytica]RFC61820.1 hypothetical protein DYI37_19225 [Fulvimarina endophytica]
MAKEARIVCEVPIVASAGTGTRIVASEDGELFHVFHRPSAERDLLTPQQTFNLPGALETARKVLAGNPLASTAPETLRILAAAVMIGAATDPHAVLAAPSDDGAQEREEEGRAG